MLFVAHDADRAVVTLWDDIEDVDALDASTTYAQTVAAIEEAGFLRGESTVELFEVEVGFLVQGRLGFDG